MNSSDDDIGRMQQEAVRRVRDMQQRAKNISASRTGRQQAPKTQDKLPEIHETESSKNLQNHPKYQKAKSRMIFFRGIFLRIRKKALSFCS